MLMPSLFKNNLMDNFFDDDVRFPFHFPNEKTVMNTDIKELDDRFELDINVPGYANEDITAEVKDGFLIVSAETSKNNDEKDENGNYIRRERYVGKCQRTFAVGDNVKPEDIQASFKDGVLQVVVPKVKVIPEKEERKLIEIQ